MSQDNKDISQAAILFEYYEKHPGRNVPHPEIVDWAIAEYQTRTGKVLRDPDRAIRKLHQEGLLIKVDKGVYRYDPERTQKRQLQPFPPKIKEAIFVRDKYRCVVCGRGRREGVEIHADHVKAMDYDGEATVENGETLCGQHNYLKKNYGQTELGKKLFIRLYDAAKKIGDEPQAGFAAEVLQVYEKAHIDDHIKWRR